MNESMTVQREICEIAERSDAGSYPLHRCANGWAGEDMRA